MVAGEVLARAQSGAKVQRACVQRCIHATGCGRRLFKSFSAGRRLTGTSAKHRNISVTQNTAAALVQAHPGLRLPLQTLWAYYYGREGVNLTIRDSG